MMNNSIDALPAGSPVLAIEPPGRNATIETEGINMDNLCQGGAASFQLKIVGKMTYESYRELEDRIIDAMRRHKTLEIDLGEVSEIDLCGLHLVGLLHRAGIVVALSPAIEQAAGRLLATQHSTALGRLSRHEGGSLHSSGELALR